MSEFIRDNKYALWKIDQTPDGYLATSESYLGGQISTTAKTRDELFDRIDTAIRGRARVLSRDDAMPVAIGAAVVGALGALAVPKLRSPIAALGMAAGGFAIGAIGMRTVNGGQLRPTPLLGT